MRLVLLALLRRRAPAMRCTRCCTTSSGSVSGSVLGHTVRRLRFTPQPQPQPQVKLPELHKLLPPGQPVLVFEARLRHIYWKSCLSGLAALIAVYNLADYVHGSWYIAQKEEKALRRRLVEDTDEEADEKGEDSWSFWLTSRLPSSRLWSPLSLLISLPMSLLIGIASFYTLNHSRQLVRRLVLEPGGRQLLVSTLWGARRFQLDRLRLSDKTEWRWLAPLYDSHLLLAAAERQSGPQLLAVSRESAFVTEPEVFAALLRLLKKNARLHEENVAR